MAANQLAVYNAALGAIGERPLASGEANEASRILDEVWNRGTGGAVRFCLSQGLWNFAMRAVRFDSDSAVDPAFGLAYGFSQPSDFVRIAQISADENFSFPLTDYEDEAGYWYSNADPIYVRYVSDDDAYGADYAKWTPTFLRWVGLYLAVEIAPRLKSDIDMERLEKRKTRALHDARSKDALNERTRFPPLGSWASARLGGRGRRRDRGPRDTLIG